MNNKCGKIFLFYYLWACETLWDYGYDFITHFSLGPKLTWNKLEC
jgi:hypothetical protein